MAGKKKVFWWIGGVLFAVVGGVGYMIGPEAVAAVRNGFFADQKKVAYTGDRIDNLRRLQTAMMLYHESEGQFPRAEGWMDAIENRLQTNELKPGEGIKKLHDPSLGDDPNVYGYAMNDLASAKYKDDLPGKDEFVLLFTSADTKRNARGAPKGELGITISGKLLHDLK